MSKVTSLFVSICAASTLAACGGGNSGNVVPFTGFSALPSNGTVRVEGEAVTANYAVDAVTGDVTVSGVSGPNDAAQVVRVSGGFTETISIQAPGANATLDLTTGSGGLISGDRVAFVSADLETAAIFDAVSPSYEYQTYGTWFTGSGTSGSGNVGAGSFGAPTPASSVPSGTANYSGTGIGFARDSAGRGYFTDFDVSASTDFATISVSSSNTITEDIASGAIAADSDFDWSGTGSVSGADFSASITSTATSGTASGTFYGPNAEEFGGTFTTSGSGGAVHFGAFGGQ